MTDLAQMPEHLLKTYLLPFAWKLAGALALWVVGWWAINLLSRVLGASLLLKDADPTLVVYGQATLRVSLRILLILAVLSIFGVETTSFAALLAGAGVAIGAAWSGLLSNLAAGVFLVVLRPFRVGDVISAAGLTGEVKEIGLFATAIDTADNVRAFVGNTRVINENILNYSANAHRRLELRVQIAHGIDLADAIARVRDKLPAIPNVLQNPEPLVGVTEFNNSGMLLAVRPCCAQRHYLQVFFDTNRMIHDTFEEAGFPVPATYQVSLPAGAPPAFSKS